MVYKPYAQEDAQGCEQEHKDNDVQQEPKALRMDLVHVYVHTDHCHRKTVLIINRDQGGAEPAELALVDGRRDLLIILVLCKFLDRVLNGCYTPWSRRLGKVVLFLSSSPSG